MTVGDKIKAVGVAYDRRVRSRLLASGVLDAGTVETYLAELPDLEDQSDLVAVDQPALGSSMYGRLDPDSDDDDGYE